jgi:clan AA aspartic protease (TIGR02281 family)
VTGRLAVAALVALVVAAPAAAEWTSGGDGEVRLDGDGTSWLVHATLDGKLSGLFLIDTGATYCILTAATARRLRLSPGPAQAEMRTANGVVRVPVVQVPTIDVGGNRAHAVTAVVHDAVESPLAGILGLSYLDHFKYSIDPKRRVLRLH